MKNDLKSSLKEIYVLFDHLEKLADNPNNLKKRFRDILRAEFLIYVLYIIKPKNIDNDLLIFLNDVFELNFINEKYMRIIEDMNLENYHLDVGDFKSTYLFTSFKEFIGQFLERTDENGYSIQKKIFNFYIYTGIYIMSSPFGNTRREAILEILGEIENIYLLSESNVKTTNNDQAIFLNKREIKGSKNAWI